MTYLSKLRILLPIVAFLFSAAAGITFAAWLDAPNAPPNYGIVGCTPPCQQEDFMPMNLSNTPQTKKGPITIEGGITGEIFYDQNPAYFIDPSSSSAAKLAGRVFIEGGPLGIRQSFTVSAGALLAVNYPLEDTAKTGSVGDAIYAYANSAKAAISAEQGNPAGYAVYSSRGINYFEGNVGIGTPAPTAKLDVAGNIKIGSSSTSCGAINSGEISFTSNKFFGCTGTSWIELGGGYAPGQQIFDVPGSFSFTVPSGVTSINVEAWGAGGGGGYGILTRQFENDWNRVAGGGGGSGAYARKMAIPVTPGEVISGVVGTMGTGALRPASQNPPNTAWFGTATSFKGVVVGGGSGGVSWDYLATSGSYNGYSMCANMVQQPGGTVISGGSINIGGLAGQSCLDRWYGGGWGDRQGGAPSMATDHNDIPVTYGAGGTGHHFPVEPYTANPELFGNSGEGGAVIVWW